MVGAPSSINQTKAERLARDLSAATIPVEGRTQEATDRSRAEHQITRLAQQGNAYTDKAQEFIDQGILTPRDVKSAAKKAVEAPLAREFVHLGIGDALRVWNVATPEEKDELRPILIKKAANLKNLPPEQRDILTPKVWDALNQ